MDSNQLAVQGSRDSATNRAAFAILSRKSAPIGQTTVAGYNAETGKAVLATGTYANALGWQKLQPNAQAISLARQSIT